MADHGRTLWQYRQAKRMEPLAILDPILPPGTGFPMRAVGLTR